MLEDLGYHITYFNLDTEGYLHDDPVEIQESKDIWDEHVNGSNPCNTSYLAIEHDLQKQVVYNLTGYMLKSLIDNGYRPVTVGECLGDSPENWYRAGKGEVPEYTYTPLTPTGTYSCLPNRASETGPTPSADATSTGTSPTASSNEQTSSSETNRSSSAGGGESPEAIGSAKPAGSTNATESMSPDSAANSPPSARMAVCFVAVALSLYLSAYPSTPSPNFRGPEEGTTKHVDYLTSGVERTPIMSHLSLNPRDLEFQVTVQREGVMAHSRS
ncbi:hypothetical protein DL771_008499 [Monosporascus sp. 5C6A]|nr:hypothetical protein DL771_008499 [Monosporascus sp. 5C6A]